MNAGPPKIRFRRITTPFGTMVLKEHHHLDVSWETTPPSKDSRTTAFTQTWCWPLSGGASGCRSTWNRGCQKVKISPAGYAGLVLRSRGGNQNLRSACPIGRLPQSQSRGGTSHASKPPAFAHPLPPCCGPLVWGDTPVKIKMAPNLQENEHLGLRARCPPIRGGFHIDLCFHRGLAQLARAARLHRVGRWFESSSADSWSMHARHCRTSPSPEPGLAVFGGLSTDRGKIGRQRLPPPHVSGLTSDWMSLR